MKRRFIIFLAMLSFLLGIILILNIRVSTKKGVNYQLANIRLPLYLKILDFFDRHYNYKLLAETITAGAKTDEDRVLRIFEWTYKNIKDIPPGMPIIDDHTWYTIIRGYAAEDQFQDIFTTLSNYAGVKAFFSLAYEQGSSKGIALSFVSLKGKVYVFDVYRGVIFKDKTGNIADLEYLRSSTGWSARPLNGNVEIDYRKYISNLPKIYDFGLSKASIQSPLRRIIFQLKKMWQSRN